MSTNQLRRTFADELKIYYDDKDYTSAHHVIIYWSIPLSESGNPHTQQFVEIQLPSELFLQAECTRLLERYVNSGEEEEEEGGGGEEMKEVEKVEEAEKLEEEEEEVRVLSERKRELLEQLATGILEATGLPMVEEQVGVAKGSTELAKWGNLFHGGIPLVGVRFVKGKFTGKKAHRVIGFCGDDFHPPTLGADEPILHSALWHTHQLRYFLATDYTIRLKCHETGKIVSTFAVSRFLLGLRIPYFRNMFSSGMADSDTSTSTLYTDIISLEALIVVCRYVYLLDSGWMLPLFWFYTPDCTDKIQLRKNIERYISPPRRIRRTHRARRTRPPNKCEDYFEAMDTSTGDTFLPPSIINHIVNVIKAADYLSLDDLKLYMVARLQELAHDFLCDGQGCAKLLPRILDTVYLDMNIPKSILESVVQQLGRTQSIMQLWKRPLIMVRPEALEYLVEKIKNRFLRSRYTVQGQLSPEGVGECYLLYSQLTDLRMQVEAKSKNTTTEWEEKLISPLHDFCIPCLAANLAWFPRDSPSEHHIRLLKDIISSRYMVNGDYEEVWKLRSKVQGQDTLNWFKKNWLNLSLTPPQPNRKVNVCSSTPNASRKRTVSEPNFFSTWTENSQKDLALELGVEVDDLLARGHTRGHR